MVANDSVRQRIESSVFVKLNSSGHPYEERYVAHVKVWEAVQDGKGKKSRYIVLSQASDGSGFIHKAKLNCNGAFSVGKTWKVEDLREIEVVNSLVFEITPSGTTYRWQADNARDQTKFIASLIKLFQSVTGGTVPLRLIGVQVPDSSASPKAEAPPTSFRSPRASVQRAPLASTALPTQGDTPGSATSRQPLTTTKPGPPVVIWKHPIDVSRLPPIPPSPATIRPH